MSRTNRKWMPSNIHQITLEAPRPEHRHRAALPRQLHIHQRQHMQLQRSYVADAESG